VQRTGVHLEIGGLRIGLSGDDPDLKIGVRGPARRFLASPGRPDLELRARLEELRSDRGAPLFSSGSLWQVYDRAGRREFRFTSEAFGEAPYKSAVFEPDFRSGEVVLRRSVFAGRTVDPLEYPLDELLVTHLLAGGLGVEVHACGMSLNGAGLLLAGHSGAGKTTTARIWAGEPGVTVLSDDRIILRREQGELWMYGTPWHGEAAFAEPERAPLRCVFFLEQAEANALEDLPGARAAARLMACSFYPVYDAAAVDRTLAFIHAATAETPCRELRFVPDRTVVDLVTDRIRRAA
jgi:hypothetical protein